VKFLVASVNLVCVIKYTPKVFDYHDDKLLLQVSSTGVGN